MNLENIFSTEERIIIIKSIIYLEKEFGVNEIATKSKLSKGLVSKYFDILLKENILRKANKKFLVGNNNNIRSLKILLTFRKLIRASLKDMVLLNQLVCMGAVQKVQIQRNQI